MSKTLAALSCAIAAAFSLPAQAQTAAQDGPWMVRLRATYLDMNTSSDGGVLPADAISVNSKWIPEVDVSYFFTKNVAAELVLTIPQKQRVSIDGVGEIGTFKHLPPTLLAQWHFTDLGAFKPYVGAGVNLTFISSEKMSVGGTPVTLDNNSFGPALQIGADYRLDNGWYLNVDLKKVWISSDVFLGGTKIDKVSLDPYLMSVGIGKRF
jgi:outer membrane protein